MAVYGIISLSHPANLCLTPAGTYMSHWWQQEGHPAKIAPACQWKSYLGRHIWALEQGSQRH